MSARAASAILNTVDMRERNEYSIHTVKCDCQVVCIGEVQEACCAVCKAGGGGHRAGRGGYRRIPTDSER